MHIELIYSLYSSVQRKHLPGKSSSRQLCVGDAEGSWGRRGDASFREKRSMPRWLKKRGTVGKEIWAAFKNSLCEQSSAELSRFACNIY